jgi:hypothetical protein
VEQNPVKLKTGEVPAHATQMAADLRVPFQDFEVN